MSCSNQVVLGRRHKRVWKACERCRMKKIKCDGEVPCKRCKDDSIVCTTSSGKKKKCKQLPHRYAEVLENVQYTLIATVQKLYTMVRNGESWDLGEPELNDRGLPAIHNIAEKLGCIRPSSDMPTIFPEDAEEFAELQAQMIVEEMGDNGKHSDNSVSHPDRIERAPSIDSEQSELPKNYSKTLWQEQQPNSEQSQAQFQNEFPSEYPQFSNRRQYQNGDELESVPNSIWVPIGSSLYPYFQSHGQSPVLSTNSPFTPWANSNEILSTLHILDPTVEAQQRYEHILDPSAMI